MFHREWESFRLHLLRVDSVLETKRIGDENTIVFEVKPLEYDSNIPILSEGSLERWRRRAKAPTLTKITKSQACADRFVIFEDFDDEFAKYRDEDLDETPIFKNLKKIKSDIPVKTKIEPIYIRPKPLNSNRSNAIPKFPLSTPKQEVSTKEVTPINDRQESIPNWQETTKKLEDNQFSVVCRDLVHFKNHVKTNDIAKNLPKELILKCITEDDTFLLDDILTLIFELDYKEDVDFWSELVLRFKRKLTRHGQVLKFKSKTNPTVVYENYKRAMLKINEYARLTNITFRIPFHVMPFLHDPINNEIVKPSNCTNPIITEIPSESKPQFNKTSAPTETNSDMPLNDETQSNSNPSISVEHIPPPQISTEPQENQAPVDARKVKIFLPNTQPNGVMSFKITAKKPQDHNATFNRRCL